MICFVLSRCSVYLLRPVRGDQVHRQQWYPQVMYFQQYTVECGLVNDETSEHCLPIFTISDRQPFEPGRPLLTKMAFHTDLIGASCHECIPFVAFTIRGASHQSQDNS